MTVTVGKITLLPEQESALEKIHNGCILVGGVGSGKTFTSIAWYCLNHSDKPLIVITTAANRDMIKPGHEKSDWAESIEACGVTDYIIDSWNNIGKYQAVTNTCFIFDEQRVVGYGKWARTFIRIAKMNEDNDWILLSATPGDNWMDYVPVFIANGFVRNKSDFIYKHVVYKSYMKYPVVDHYVGEATLEMYRRKILIQMDVERSTTRHREYIYCDYDKDMYSKVIETRFNFLDDKPIETASELTVLLRRVINSSKDRINKVTELINNHNRSIIFYNYVYEKDLLIKICMDNDIEYGEWNGQRHDPIPNGDKWVYLVQYTAGAEGWNCITTDCMIFYSVNYAYKKMEQAEGRIDRLNTSYKDLYYYYITSKSSIDHKILQAINEKKKFNERAFSEELFGINWIERIND